MNKKAFRRVSFLIHSWMGLWFSLLMTFLSITGTLAIFSLEMDWLVNPEMRAAERVHVEDVAWGAAFDSLGEYPEYTFYTMSKLRESYFTLLASGRTSWDESIRAWLQPHNGELAGITRWYTIQRFFRELHRNLFMPTSVGVPIVSFLSLPLLISVTAGFIVYRRFWLGFFKKPRWERNIRILSGDLHRLTGLWTSWFIALIAMTSLYYLIESAGYYEWGRDFRARSAAPPVFRPIEREDRLPNEFTGSELDIAIERAKRELPGLEVTGITFPGNSNDPLVVSGNLSAILVRARANGVYIDPSNGDVLGTFQGEELNLHERISEAVDPLHFGYFGGLGSRIIWFILGLGMATMSVTGVIVYAKRLVIKERQNDSRVKIRSKDKQSLVNN